MSHSATNWAIKQRGLKPAAKVVLWHLCDRYHPDHGCFPGQDTLASDCELSRSSLNDNLRLLEKAGLIAREKRVDGRTKKRQSTRYRFAFETDFPCPDSGHGSMSEKAVEPCPKNGESHVRNSDTNPVSEPVIEPVPPKSPVAAGDRTEPSLEDDGSTSRDRARGKFAAAFASYPGFETDDRQKAWTRWQAMNGHDRNKAARYIPAHVAKWKARKKKTRQWAFWKYLEQEPWKRVEMPGERPYLGLETKNWIFRRIELALEGPGTTDDRHPDAWRALKFMDFMATQNSGVDAPEGWRPPNVPTIAVQFKSDDFAAWNEFFIRMTERRFPEPRKTEWLHFPACGPPDDAGMDDFVALFSTHAAQAAE